jgi:CubicO group peptidase (beta-lactamase class C family)
VTADLVGAALRRAVAAGEVGVQVAAFLDGRQIVDACIGDVSPGQPVRPDTLFPIWSVSKAITATAVHIQAERGLIDYDAPIARYWPEFAAHGKQDMTVRHVLTHRAGLPQMPPDVTPARMCDWEWMTGRLAEEPLLFPPGSRNTYLSITFGWLLGEVVRRTDPDRRSFADFVGDELCAPLGMDATFFGVPQEAAGRVAPLSADQRPTAPPDALVHRAVPAAVALMPPLMNDPLVQRSCIPAIGAISSASSLARMFAMLAGGGQLGGVRLLSTARVRAQLTPRPDYAVHDETYGTAFPVSVGGYWLAPGIALPNPDDLHVLGHVGAGGTVAWADLDSGLAVAVCHNHMRFDSGQPFADLAQAVRTIASTLGSA